MWIFVRKIVIAFYPASMWLIHQWTRTPIKWKTEEGTRAPPSHLEPSSYFQPHLFLLFIWSNGTPPSPSIRRRLEGLLLSLGFYITPLRPQETNPSSFRPPFSSRLSTLLRWRSAPCFSRGWPDPGPGPWSLPSPPLCRRSFATPSSIEFLLENSNLF